MSDGLRSRSPFGATTPVIVQSEASKCGLACLLMVAGYHGNRIDMPAARLTYPVSMKGSTLRDLIGIADSLRLVSRALKVDLPNLRKLRLPCILHWNHSHFVVLTRVRNNSVEINDPAHGARRVPMPEVSNSLTGIALEAWPADDFERKRTVAQIRISNLVTRTQGISQAAWQVVVLSILLEVIVVVLPIGFQIVSTRCWWPTMRTY